jgi:hypothetical protein
MWDYKQVEVISEIYIISKYDTIFRTFLGWFSG